MISIKSKRGHVKGLLTRAASFAENLDDRVSLELLETRLENLEDAWTKFVRLTDELYDHSGVNDFVDPNDDFPDYENKYFTAQATLVRVIRERKLAATPASPVVSESVIERLASQQTIFLKKLNESKKSACSIALPKLSISIFSGDYKEWPSFRDHFMGSVDNNSDLTPTQKFHYLKSFLRGDPANLIRDIKVSDSNFVEAWEKLERRYDRPNFIIQSHIQTLLSIPNMNTVNIHSLRKISDSADETIRGLDSLGATWRDPWVIYLLLLKLDQDTKEAWSLEVGARSNASVDEFLWFLNSRCDALESAQSLTRPTQSRVKNPKVIQSHFIESKPSCPSCKSDHLLSQCPQFLALDITARRLFVKDNSICFNCLRPGHSSQKCRCKFRCRTCHSRHHSLVHIQSPTNVSTAPVSSGSSSGTSTTSNSVATTQSPLSLCSSVVHANSSFSFVRSYQTLLPTAIAHIHNKQGSLQNIRLLLDSGSQVSFVTENTVQKLGLVRKNAQIPIVGVGATPAGVTNGIVHLNLYSRFTQDFIEVQCYVVSKLTSLVPTSFSTVSNTESLSSFTLADPNFNIPGHIDVLIGADKSFSIINGSAVRGQQGMPDLVPTIFGWVVCGNMETASNSVKNCVDSYCTSLDTSTSFDLERFWRLEEVDLEPTLSIEDKLAEEIFIKHHSRLPDGRYMVQLPFKSIEPTDFGNSLNVALNRFYSTERRIASSQYLRDKYVSFIDEYLNLGHMEEIPASEIHMSSSKCFYLPHHAVLKDDSSTTKVRVVFDGSAKASNKHPSLNESLLVGKSYQRDLFAICLRFRRHRYTISGDIEKMFRQIRVPKEQTDFQRILWRKSSHFPLKHYRLLTVTYGTACAPFLAVRTLYQLAIDSADTHPRASEVLLNDFYVDDVMTGADSIEEVTSLRLELVSLLKSAGLNLRKWTTNCWPLLLSLPEEQREMSPKEFEEYSSVKLLGLQWSPANDSFSYKVNLNDQASSTKRQILSESSRIFDPIGFLTPVVIGIKILFQELWRKKYKWDDVISSEHAKNWHCIRDELPTLEKINIPRIMWTSKTDNEYHGFCDASLDAYAAVIYCRSVDSFGNITSNIVAAKSKVAPIKVVSLPRLELCGAVLLTRLVTKLKTSLQDKEMKVYAWTDSAIVLHWLSALPKRWSVFIGNRTSEILSTIPRESWHHVRSEYNPADCASRGVLPSHLIQNELWWTGPLWIIKERDEWPNSEYSVGDIQPETFEVRKKIKTCAFVAKLDPTNLFYMIIDDSSSFIKSTRVLGFIFRYIANIRELVAIRKLLKNGEISDPEKIDELKKFIANARDKSAPKTQSLALSSLEISTAKTKLIQFHQDLSFSNEINCIKSAKNLKKGNKLASLAPFVDKQGLLRVGGRIQESDAAYSVKHPIILDKNTRIAKLIVEQLHKSNCHAGVSLLFAIIRQEYYIIGCRNMLRKIVHKCVSCFRQQKTTSTQQMGNLPADRVLFSRPFSKVGVDYAGPITLRQARGRNPKFTKAYIALFVCFSTKAIHVELVGDLSTNAFLAALNRFASRRGKPSEIWSDNGTNFHGAKRCLNEMFELLMSQQHNDIITDHLSKDRISWNFIPPSSPHFGGLWEAGVKSVKFHLNRVIKDHRLTYEEMYTLLTQIEALLNSRPMWPTSDMDPIALSPAHFLIGEPMTSIPHPYIHDQNIFTNWSLLQSLKQGFWKRWHSEYLTSLQQRPKWQGVKPDLKPGDVVMLKDSNLPPAKWILGRIKEVHPGKDERVRVATITTQTGDYVRPIVKIAPLPFAERTGSFRGG